MLRDRLIEKGVGVEKSFRWRSHEISRIEGLSDAVFAFGVTLLVISLEVPHTFTELMEKMHGFAAFALSFMILFHIWFLQFKFFRRFGLQDILTVTLNGVLLFVVLFYVYPLKFLFSFLVNVFTGGGGMARLPGGRLEPMVVGAQGQAMMVIYGVGFMAIYAVFVLLYLHAWRKREELQLNELEKLITRACIGSNMLNVGVGLLSVAVAVIGGPRYAGLAGPVYFLVGILQAVFWTVVGRRARPLEERAAASG